MPERQGARPGVGRCTQENEACVQNRDLLHLSSPSLACFGNIVRLFRLPASNLLVGSPFLQFSVHTLECFWAFFFNFPDSCAGLRCIYMMDSIYAICTHAGLTFFLNEQAEV